VLILQLLQCIPGGLGWAGLSSEQMILMAALRLPSSSFAETACAKWDEADLLWDRVEMTSSWATELGKEAIRFLITDVILCYIEISFSFFTTIRSSFVSECTVYSGYQLDWKEREKLAKIYLYFHPQKFSFLPFFVFSYFKSDCFGEK